MIDTALLWLAEDGFLLSSIDIIDTSVSLAQPGRVDLAELVDPVAVRKDDAPAAVQAAMANVAGMATLTGGGGLMQTTSG